ncbi:MAG: WecB/TagA/CpsF family glycosyltransferase [Bacillota bacterium]
MKSEILGAAIDNLTLAAVVQKTASLLWERRRVFVLTLNPEYLYRAQHDPALLELAGRADIVTPDGTGIVWACAVAGTPVPERVTGIDLMLALLAEAAGRGWRVYLLGAAPGVADEAAANLQRRFPGLQICGTWHGYFVPQEAEQVLADIAEKRPQLLFVALGAPRQEIWLAENLSRIPAPVVGMGVGGSFDVLAGRVRRAPLWMQKAHIEWLWRLIQEPRRWRRMLVLPKFAWLVLREYKLGRRSKRR